jgi:hypothetical protein
MKFPLFTSFVHFCHRSEDVIAVFVCVDNSGG